MTNKELLECELKRLGLELGCYNDKINRINKSEVKKILNNIEEEHTDIKIKFMKKDYVIEIKTVDKEKDLDMLSLEEYNSLYGYDE